MELRGPSFLIFLGLTAFSNLAFSQVESPVTRLSWEQCIELATTGNFELRSAQEAFNSADHLARAAWSGFLPKLSGSTSYSHGNSAVDSYSATLSASQNLFAGFSDSGKVRQARANRDSALSTLRITQARISFELKSAYQGVLYAQSYRIQSQEIARRRTANLRMVELRFNSGRENKGSVLLSKANLAQAQLDALQAQHTLEVSQAQLVKVLGLEPTDAPSAFEVTSLIPALEPENQPNFLKLSLETPERLLSIAKEEAASAATTVSRAAFFPDLSLSGQYGKVGTSFFPDSLRWSTGITFSLPLFTGGKDYYSLKSSSALASAAALDRENQDRALPARLKQTYTEFIEATQKLKVDEAFYEAAVVRAQVAREKYNNGLLSFEDWDTIETDLVTREKARLQSQRARVLAQAAWEQALGKGVIQ